MADLYVVTGGAGFVGANLCAEIARRAPGARVACLDDFRAGSFANLIEAYERRNVGAVSCDVHAAGWNEAAFRLDASERATVLHMAAITDTTIDDQAEMLDANSGDGWDELLAICVESGSRLVYASSAATYGTPGEAASSRPFPLDAAGTPDNIYGFSKWVMENQHRRVQREHPDAHIVGLRFFNVFGPGESAKGKMASMAYKLAQQMLRGERPAIFADGGQARDQVYVDDVVDCVLHAAGLGENPTPKPGIYNLGSGRATTFNQVVDAVREGLGIASGELPTEYIEMPADIARFYQSFTLADMSETKAGLGWEPGHDPIEALQGYAAYLRKRHETSGGPA
ncbi:MAG: NAD-dependent epimerase/dehydratase family protein [Planctomycetota bacterium]